MLLIVGVGAANAIAAGGRPGTHYRHRDDIKPLMAIRGGATGQYIPVEAVAGGMFIGVASGAAMMTSSRVAGCSGALKSGLMNIIHIFIELPPSYIDFNGWKMGFLAGLVLAGRALASYLPALLEDAPSASRALALGGVAVGAGTAWANGCTSGHGLAGLSRLSLRSLVAVATFMTTAIATRTAQTGVSYGMVPLVASSSVTREIGALAAALAAALPLIRYLVPSGLGQQILLGLWTGGTFGTGLVVGGMARPSAVQGALSPVRLDLTLWTLFTTALCVTFVLYRLAEANGVREARADQPADSRITRELVVGSALFGVGWALTGLCPGPLAVGIGAKPSAPGLLLVLGAFTFGAILSSLVRL